jgi:hypothetical protein
MLKSEDQWHFYTITLVLLHLFLDGRLFLQACEAIVVCRVFVRFAHAALSLQYGSSPPHHYAEPCLFYRLVVVDSS